MSSAAARSVNSAAAKGLGAALMSGGRHPVAHRPDEAAAHAGGATLLQARIRPATVALVVLGHLALAALLLSMRSAPRAPEAPLMVQLIEPPKPPEPIKPPEPPQPQQLRRAVETPPPPRPRTPPAVQPAARTPPPPVPTPAPPPPMLAAAATPTAEPSATVAAAEPGPAPSPPSPPSPPAAPSPPAPPPAPVAKAVATPLPAPTAPRFDADYLDNPRPAYPPVSRKTGEQGDVLLRVLVDAQGAPERLELRQSSGFERLDRAALSAVSRWRFVPARQGDKAVAAWVLVPISFSLNQE